MSANAEFSTPLKCLALGKKSIEQLRPSVPRQTSALDPLVFYCFRILLVYPCALYYGMLILSRAHGACPIGLLLLVWHIQILDTLNSDIDRGHDGAIMA